MKLLTLFAHKGIFAPLMALKGFSWPSFWLSLSPLAIHQAILILKPAQIPLKKTIEARESLEAP